MSSISSSSLSSDSSPSANHSSPRHPSPTRSFKANRERVYRDAPPSTLLRLLIKEEYQVKETRKLLDHVLADSTQRMTLTDTEPAMHLLQNDQMKLAKAQEEAYLAKSDLQLYKLHSEHAQRELERAREVLQVVDAQREGAERSAMKARTVARRLKDEKLVMMAREQGRKEGFEEGLRCGRSLALAREHGRILAYNQLRRVDGDHLSYIEGGSAFIEEAVDEDSANLPRHISPPRSQRTHRTVASPRRTRHISLDSKTQDMRPHSTVSSPRTPTQETTRMSSQSVRPELSTPSPVERRPASKASVSRHGSLSSNPDHKRRSEVHDIGANLSRHHSRASHQSHSNIHHAGGETKKSPMDFESEIGATVMPKSLPVSTLLPYLPMPAPPPLPEAFTVTPQSMPIPLVVEPATTEPNMHRRTRSSPDNVNLSGSPASSATSMTGLSSQLDSHLVSFPPSTNPSVTGRPTRFVRELSIIPEDVNSPRTVTPNATPVHPRHVNTGRTDETFETNSRLSTPFKNKRSVEEWRNETQIPGHSASTMFPGPASTSPSIGFLHPPSQFMQPLSTGNSMDTSNSSLRRASSGSSHSIEFQIVPPSRPSSVAHHGSQSDEPLGGYLSPNHTPKTLVSPELEEESPVIPGGSGFDANFGSTAQFGAPKNPISIPNPIYAVPPMFNNRSTPSSVSSSSSTLSPVVGFSEGPLPWGFIPQTITPSPGGPNISLTPSGRPVTPSVAPWEGESTPRQPSFMGPVVPISSIGFPSYSGGDQPQEPVGDSFTPQTHQYGYNPSPAGFPLPASAYGSPAMSTGNRTPHSKRSMSLNAGKTPIQIYQPLPGAPNHLMTPGQATSRRSSTLVSDAFPNMPTFGLAPTSPFIRPGSTSSVSSHHSYVVPPFIPDQPASRSSSRGDSDRESLLDPTTIANTQANARGWWPGSDLPSPSLYQTQT